MAAAAACQQGGENRIVKPATNSICACLSCHGVPFPPCGSACWWALYSVHPVAEQRVAACPFCKQQKQIGACMATLQPHGNCVGVQCTNGVLLRWAVAAAARR